MRDVQGSVYADLIGKPFAWGGRTPSGYDCFGLVLEMFKRTGRNPPDWRSPSDIAAAAGAGVVMGELSQHQWMRCDRAAETMILFNMPINLNGRRVLAATHCGFMLSNSEFIHSWEDTGGVTVERTADWERRIAGFYTYREEK